MKKILVVDDISSNAAILSKILEPDYDVFIALNGPAALKIVSRVQPDILLLDINMPDMNGFEVLKRLRENPQTALTPVIFITASAEVETEAESFKLGANDYITKPFVSEIVRLRVQKELQLKEHRDGLETIVRERTREIEETRAAVISGMAFLAEHKDSNTGAHLQRITSISTKVAECISIHYPALLSPEDALLTGQLASVHDIGKVAIPEHILNKPGSLDPSEFGIIKQHSAIGAEVIRDIQHIFVASKHYLEIAWEIARNHHERYDGTGYPDALAGDKIPLAARIVAVCDVYDALISERPYKKAFPKDRALSIIREASGTQFDPLVVDCFIRLFESGDL